MRAGADPAKHVVTQTLDKAVNRLLLVSHQQLHHSLNMRREIGLDQANAFDGLVVFATECIERFADQIRCLIQHHVQRLAQADARTEGFVNNAKRTGGLGSHSELLSLLS